MPNNKRVPVVADPIGCPTCGAAWSFVTDGPFGLGVIRAVHPPGKCVARAEVPLFNERVVRCAYCKRDFEKHANAQRFCSSRCRDKRNRYEREYYRSRRKAA